jgi:sensor domain CHASE-containing protein
MDVTARWNMNRKDFVRLLLVILIGAVIGVCASWAADLQARNEFSHLHEQDITVTGFPDKGIAQRWIDTLLH